MVMAVPSSWARTLQQQQQQLCVCVRAREQDSLYRLPSGFPSVRGRYLSHPKSPPSMLVLETAWAGGLGSGVPRDFWFAL